MSTPSQRAADLCRTLRDDAAATDIEGSFPTASIDALRRAGLLAAPLPAAAGGESIGAPAQCAELLATLAAIGHGSLVVGRLYEGHVNALQLIARYASNAARKRWQADAAEGRLFGVWNTEATDGVHLRADQAGGGYTLAGSKTFASGCGHVDRALVTARTEAGGWQMVVLDVRARPPRVDRRFWQPLGMRASASFRADFGGLSLPADDLLGAPGDYYREPAFSGGAIRFAAVQQGGVEAVFDETRRFLRAQGRTDDPHQRARVGEMAVRVESGRLWLVGAARHAAAAMGDRGEPAGTPPVTPAESACARPDGNLDDAAAVVAYAHLMRSAIEAQALAVLRLAERCVGARGLLRPEPFERLHRDLTHYLRQPAPDAVLVAAGAHVLARDAAAAMLWR